MATTGGRVVAGAPADAALGHRGTTAVGHVAAACGGGLGDVGHLAGSHRRGAYVL